MDWFIAGLLIIAALQACNIMLHLFIIIPMRFRRSQGVVVESEMNGFDPDKSVLPQEIRTNIQTTVEQLSRHGFLVRGHFLAKVHEARPPAYLTVLEHSKNLDVAKFLQAFIVHAKGNDLSVTLAFQTKCPDGTKIVTTNLRVPSPQPRDPNVKPIYLPRIRDAGELYEIHMEIVEHLGASGERQLPATGDLSIYLRDEVKEMHSRWVSAGHYFLDESAKAYRLTWKGAIISCLKMYRPVQNLRLWWTESRAARLLRTITKEKLSRDRS